MSRGCTSIRRTCSRLKRISVDWRGIRFVEDNIEQTSEANMVIVMIGGSDIDNGMPILKLVDRLVKMQRKYCVGGMGRSGWYCLYMIYTGYQIQ